MYMSRDTHSPNKSAILFYHLSSPQLFDWLRKEHPEALNKLVPIRGDITCPELGISVTDQKILAENVSVVFHSAATVKFDEALKLSVAMNIMGTKRLVQLCHKMVKLEEPSFTTGDYHTSDLDDRLTASDYHTSDLDDRLTASDYHTSDLDDSLTTGDYHTSNLDDSLTTTNQRFGNCFIFEGRLITRK
uniref:Fatty acyl-CoA reductase n=1 Tax=Timema poppense TaxID=170557 RepID=A0A7R9CJA9_TIMPO|nr:unnamed protein product [Timema poppensis]